MIRTFGDYNATDYYYLHTNGDLIHKYKTVVESDPEYFDSPFVKQAWGINTESRACAWMLCIEALAMGANKKRVFELKKKWNLTDKDGLIFAEHMQPFKAYKDGDSWCVIDKDNFTNIQESQVGFGDTILEAFADFIKDSLFMVVDK